MSLISVNGLVRYYGNHRAVNAVSLQLQQGDILGLLGPNGAGKSTTMRMLSGNLAPSEGEIRINDIDLLEQPAAAKRHLGYLPEQPPLYPEMTVDEYLVYCARLHRVAAGDIDAAVQSAKQRCGLAEVGHRLIGNLSKGYQQRTGIAQAIVHTPRVIILDEPTVGLDPIQIREIRSLIRELGEDHGIILSTHILPEVEAVCNRVLIINEGELVFESTMDALSQEETSNSYHIAFAIDVSVEQLEKLDGIVKASPEEDGFLVQLDTSPQNFIKTAVYAGWELAQLQPAEHTLEQVFIRLAHNEATNEDEAAA